MFSSLQGVCVSFIRRFSRHAAKLQAVRHQVRLDKCALLKTIRFPKNSNTLEIEGRRDLGKRLVRWFTYNLGFALLPLVAAVTLRVLNGTLTTQAVSNSSEILFFALMVSATAMGDISEVTVPVGWDLRFRVFWSCLLLGGIWSAILYGGLLYDSIIGPGSPSFRSRLLVLSIIVAVLLFLVSTIVEILLGRIIGEGRPDEVEA